MDFAALCIPRGDDPLYAIQKALHEKNSYLPFFRPVIYF